MKINDYNSLIIFTLNNLYCKIDLLNVENIALTLILICRFENKLRYVLLLTSFHYEIYNERKYIRI